MNKRRLHHAWKRFRIIRPWYFLVLTVVLTAVCVFSLRANNEHMIKLRSAVYAADQNNGDVEGALKNLQAYVTAHMNTNLSAGPNPVYPPIQLKYTYDRLVQAQSASLASSNTQLYTQAQQYCQQLDPTDFSGHNRVPCIEQYVETHNAALPTIPDSLYKFDFISPTWSPDLAGWSLLATIISALVCIVSFLADKWLKRNVS
jgi:hypothetical protein